MMEGVGTTQDWRGAFGNAGLNSGPVAEPFGALHRSDALPGGRESETSNVPRPRRILQGPRHGEVDAVRAQHEALGASRSPASGWTPIASSTCLEKVT